MFGNITINDYEINIFYSSRLNLFKSKKKKNENSNIVK